MPDPDRASRAIIPYFGGALRGGKAELFILDARFRKEDDRRGVADGVLFRGWGRLSFLKSGIHVAWILVSSTRMTWNWLSADAGKAAFMPPGCSLSQGGRGGVSQTVCFFAGGDASRF